MDEDLRLAIQQLNTRIIVLQAVIARIVERDFSPEEIESWHDALLRTFERSRATRPTELAALTAALDETFRILRDWQSRR